MTKANPQPTHWITGRKLMVLSVISRFAVLMLLCLLAMWTEYLNLKVVHNHPRLVELSSGKAMRVFYEYSDAFFSTFGDPVEVMQTNGGMTWSIRIMGVQFTDPVAAMSLLATGHHWPGGFAIGLIIPIGLAIMFGRVFCSYICPASLLFFLIARIRRLMEKFFYLPQITVSPTLAWGILVGGLVVAMIYGHGVWTLILPYFAIGQTLFHGLAFGALSSSIVAIVVFALADLFLGHQFVCRNVCPTGRLLGFVGRKQIITVRRDATQCVQSCQSCVQICPLGTNPKIDQLVDCSLCGECLTICPTKCLSVGFKQK